MSFADSMNSLDAMNDDDVVINEIRLPSVKSLALKVISLFKPSNTVDASRAQYIQQPNISQHS
ncbi:hypothetical protein [Pseudomonas kuykendallii]|uniref:hypothetical protein n=1 Tax=Pseudomonas kuykendallii TaxID=1007099 RepID=UPI0028D068A5|nr:hypothetical protein [Pseudomonas kuykendallii]